jgi:hypothetical protein
MAITRTELSASDQRYFARFDRWQGPLAPVNVIRDLLDPAEIALKRERYAPLLETALETARTPLDLTEDWDRLHGQVFAKMNAASLYYLFTGDPSVVPEAIAAFEACEACPRPHFTYSTCVGILDLDLRTAHVAHFVAVMECCFGDALPVDVRRRMRELVIDRILAPGLEAERTVRYAWMESDANWRIILCGAFAIAGMVYRDDFPAWRALVDYGIEAMLVCAATGDRQGSWNEGPGYWEYGFDTGVAFLHALRLFTGGAVDLFRHPFYAHTGDFRVFMQPRPGVNWNWSDCGKEAGASTALVAFARATRNPLYQHAVEESGLHGLWQLYWYDPALPAAPPAAADCTRYFPGVGALIWRTGFAPEDTFIGVKGGDLLHYNHHCHLDMGSLVVHAAGQELLAELDHWPYPHEGIKDPSKKGYQPGFYDIENKRWMGIDFDNKLAEGHNGVSIEGHLPEFRLKAPARFLRRIDTPALKVAVVDSTAMFTPAVSRVRRYVIFLPPDILLLVDEIRAPQPVRARLHFHYPFAQPPALGIGNVGPAHGSGIDAAVEWGTDSFRIAVEHAELRARLLCPAAEDHLILGHNERRTTYRPPAGLLTRVNKYLYAENLYRKPRLTFVTAMQFGPTGFAEADFTLVGEPIRDTRFSVRVRRSEGVLRIAVDMGKITVNIQ